MITKLNFYKLSSLKLKISLFIVKNVIFRLFVQKFRLILYENVIKRIIQYVFERKNLNNRVIVKVLRNVYVINTLRALFLSF